MYLIIHPILDLFGNFSSDYTQRQEVIKKSLFSKYCRRNLILSYLLIIVEVLTFSLFVGINYKVSTKQLPISVIFGLSLAILTFYLFFSLYFYSLFEIEENRTEANEILEEMAMERLERIVAGEQVENFQEISVGTNYITRTNSETTEVD